MPASNPLHLDQARITAVVNTLHAFGVGLTGALQRVVTAIQPVAEAAHAYFDRPDVQASIGKVLQGVREMHDRIEAVDAPGYKPYFEHLGCSGFEARLYTGMIRGVARRRYEDDRSRRVALTTLHDLGKRPRWHPALAQQVTRLSQHHGGFPFLDEAFERAACAELKNEFLGLLLSTRDGAVNCGPRLLAIVARIAPYLPSPRGRPVRLETVLHRTFLDWSGHFGGRQAYTYGPVPGTEEDEQKDDFIDPATAATRIELSRPRFNPVAARRNGRKRHPSTKQ